MAGSISKIVSQDDGVFDGSSSKPLLTTKSPGIFSRMFSGGLFSKIWAVVYSIFRKSETEKEFQEAAKESIEGLEKPAQKQLKQRIKRLKSWTKEGAKVERQDRLVAATKLLKASKVDLDALDLRGLENLTSLPSDFKSFFSAEIVSNLTVYVFNTQIANYSRLQCRVETRNINPLHINGEAETAARCARSCKE